MADLARIENPAWAVVDEKTNRIKMAPDKCLAIFDTRNAASRVAGRTKGAIVRAVDISKSQ